MKMLKMALTGLAALLAVAVSAAMAETFQAIPVKTGLDFPTVLAVAPDRTIFYGERLTGEIHTINPTMGGDRLMIVACLSTSPSSPRQFNAMLRASTFTASLGG
jgi:streptogramin lyase